MAVDFVRGELHALEGVREPSYYTLMATFQGGQWSSICLEYGLSSCGATSDEAIDRLREVLLDSLQHEFADGSSVPTPISWDELDDWLRRHRGNAAVVVVAEPVPEDLEPPAA